MARWTARHPSPGDTRNGTSKGEIAMNLLIRTLAAAAACTMSALGAFAQSTVFPVDKDPAPRSIVQQSLPGPLKVNT
jgi:hypothetical protein